MRKSGKTKPVDTVFDPIKTRCTQETLIKSAADLLAEETPNYH